MTIFFKGGLRAHHLTTDGEQCLSILNVFPKEIMAHAP
jgi:hypothetical protein